MIDKCRTCLKGRKKLRSVFSKPGKSLISYSDMLTAISNVQITENDPYSYMICIICCRRLKDAYDFKHMAERTNATIMDLSSKRIYFSNISEVKVEFDLIKTEPNDDYNDDKIALDFNTNGNAQLYNTTIKKLITQSDNVNISKENKTLTITEFLENVCIEDSDDDLFDDDGDTENNIDQTEYGPLSEHDDEEYLPSKRNDKIVSYTKKRKPKAPEICTILKTPVAKFAKIKPVFVDKFSIVPTTPVFKKKNKKEPVKKMTVCPYCGLCVSNYKSHQLQHTGEKKFKCDQCSSSYFFKKQLDKHKMKHTGVRSFKCSNCVAAFFDQRALASHMLSHTRDPKFVCGICSKKYIRKNALHRHEKMHNLANKNIKCELCNMSFFTKGGLNHHMRIHTGERPYKCELCSQPYSYKHDFNRHCFKKHGIFLKRRKVAIMNEETLAREREVMKQLMLRARGLVTDGESRNLFELEGPEGYRAYEMAMKLLKENKIPIDDTI